MEVGAFTWEIQSLLEVKGVLVGSTNTVALSSEELPPRR